MNSPQVAKQIGGRLGEVEEVEWKKKRDDVNFFMRVRVALPISKPLGEEVLLLGWMESGIGWITNTRDYLFSAIIVGFWGMTSRTVLLIMQQRRMVELKSTSMESFLEQ